MDVLKNYVDNIFSPYEENLKSLQLKENILSHMEDQYEDLKAQNISEEEIIGTIITKFGSFDDLLSELNLKSKEKINDLTKEDMEIINEYKPFSKKFPIYIAIGVVLCIFAAGLFPFLEEYIGDSIAIIVFFIFIAAGVSLFIISGIKKSYFTNYFKSRNLTQYYDTSEDNYINSENYKKYSSAESAVHGILWLVIVGIYLLLGFVGGYWHPGWIIFVIGGLLSAIISLIFELFLRGKK